MGSKNKNSIEIINSGIFDNILNFEDLRNRILNTPSYNNRGIEKTKGDIFEIFIEALLITNNQFQIKEVYPQGYVPFKILKELNLDPNDDGYDGVYITKDDRYATYQVKFRKVDQKLKWQGKNGLSSFIGVSYYADIRHLFANTTLLPKSYERQPKTLSFLLNDFIDLNQEDFKKVSDFLRKKEIKNKFHIPDKFQEKAVNDLYNELKKKPRATCIMACGTGKTEVGYWVYKKIKPKISLVLVPSIALVKQIRAAWLSQIPNNNPVMTFQLCSSKDITKDEDCVKVRKSDLSMEFFSDKNNLKEWLKKKPSVNKIIFSTYQSSKILKGIFTKKKNIDFAVFDEAHRTAVLNQSVKSNFSFALKDENIPIKKRLFMTATRRVHNYKKKNKFGDANTMISMDKSEIYGKVVTDISFFEAANKYKAIAKPKLIISEVFSEEVEFEKRKISSTHVKGMKLKSDYLALLIAIKKAVKKHKLKKIFSFHSGISRAKQFTDGDQPDSIKYYLKDFFTSSVTGSMRMRKRDLIMDQFKESQKSIVSNARCLIEGVNVPSVDMVAFIDNKSSEIDIVQAIGRALRKPRDKNNKKEFGYILVPLFIERKKNETLQKAIERTNFKKIVFLFKSLKEHDSEVAQLISDILINETRGKGFAERTKKELEGIFDTNHPEITKKLLTNSIQSNIIEDLRLKWDEMVGYLKKFKDVHGHLKVTYSHKEFDELRKWITVVRLRYRRKELFPFQVDQLEKLGFDWKEQDATVYSKGKLKSAHDLAKKFKKHYQSFKKIIERNIKPDQMYFGTGIMKPIPLYQDYDEKTLCKLLNVTFLDTKDYVTKTEISTKFKVDLRIIQTLIDKKKIKLMGNSIGVSSSDGKYYENISEEKLKRILGVDILDTKGLYNKSNLYKSIFKSKEFPQYGATPVINLINSGKIKPYAIGIGKSKEKQKGIKDNKICARVYYFKPLNKKTFTKISGIDLFNRDNLQTRSEIMINAFGKDITAYFNLCEEEGLIKSVGIGPGTGEKGLSKFYKKITLKELKSLKKIDYFEKPTHLCNLNNVSKILGKSHTTTRSMIDNKFIKPVARGYDRVGITDLYEKKTKKDFLEIYNNYRKYILSKQTRYQK